MDLPNRLVAVGRFCGTADGWVLTCGALLRVSGAIAGEVAGAAATETEMGASSTEVAAIGTPTIGVSASGVSTLGAVAPDAGKRSAICGGAETSGADSDTLFRTTSADEDVEGSANEERLDERPSPLPPRLDLSTCCVAGCSGPAIAEDEPAHV
jgi:hypothetical protein